MPDLAPNGNLPEVEAITASMAEPKLERAVAAAQPASRLSVDARPARELVNAEAALEAFLAALDEQSVAPHEDWASVFRANPTLSTLATAVERSAAYLLRDAVVTVEVAAHAVEVVSIYDLNGQLRAVWDSVTQEAKLPETQARDDQFVRSAPPKVRASAPTLQSAERLLSQVAERARRWADRGDMASAAASVMGDLRRHPATAALACERLERAIRRAKDGEHVEELVLSAASAA